MTLLQSAFYTFGTRLLTAFAEYAILSAMALSGLFIYIGVLSQTLITQRFQRKRKANMENYFNKNYGYLRCEMSGGLPYFSAADVTLALKFTDAKAAATAYCKHGKRLETLTPQGLREIMFIPADDFCRLVAMSKWEGKFGYSAWVFESVLPQLLSGISEAAEMRKALCGNGLSVDENGIAVFENSVIGSVRTVMQNDEPWFVAVDVCKALELSNPTVSVANLEESERAKLNLGRQGEAVIISEGGLYALIFRSRKPQAKVFAHWVTHEVLPSIRKRGLYATNELLADSEALNAALYDLRKERLSHGETKQQLAAAQEQLALVAEKKKKTAEKVKATCRKTRESETLTTRKVLIAMMRRVSTGAFRDYKHGANAFYACLKRNAGIDLYERRKVWCEEHATCKAPSLLDFVREDEGVACITAVMEHFGKEHGLSFDDIICKHEAWREHIAA